jgi:muramoyltetrapeptide carboxypeptidase
VIRPPALRPGDLIGIVSPASPTAALVPRRFARGIAALEQRGFRVRVAEHALARDRHTAGTIDERLDDLHAMFADADVRGIVCTTGGFNSNQLLEGLDFDLIAANPKVFVGYSDITALHAAIWTRTELAVVLGPSLLMQWAEFGGMHDHTWRYFERTLMRGEPGLIEPASEWTDEYTQWEEADDRPRVMQPNPGPRAIREGEGEGWVAAVNLSTLLLLAGTPWFPVLDDALLCLEDDDLVDAAFLDRLLTQLRHLGVLARAAGLAIGRFQTASEIDDETLDAIVLRATRGLDLPVAAGFDFGHTDPMCCLPWGVRARLDGTRLELLEPPVA